MQPVTYALFHTHKRKTQNSALCYSFQKSCKQRLVWDHDLTYSTPAFFCEAAKICKLPMNKRNRPICTCVLQTRLNDTVWEHKSLQVLISGNLCLKVKHFSSSGPVLVTAQPLSVIPSLSPCLTQRKNCKSKMPGAKREDPRGSKAHSSHLMRDRRIAKTAVTPAHCRVFEKGWINHCLHRPWVAGMRRRQETRPRPTGLSNSIFKILQKMSLVSYTNIVCKDYLKSWKEEARSYSLCYHLHPLFPLFWQELLLITVTEQKINIRSVAVTASDLHRPTETCLSP